MTHDQEMELIRSTTVTETNVQNILLTIGEMKIGCEGHTDRITKCEKDVVQIKTVGTVIQGLVTVALGLLWKSK